MRLNIPLTEEFEAANYRAYTVDQDTTDAVAMGRIGNPGYAFGLSTQEHVDVRTFVRSGENWMVSGATPSSAVTLGHQASYNHWPGLVVNLASGTTVLSSSTDAIDLSVIESAEITLALPDFPLGSIDLAQSALELSSDHGTTYASLSFASSSTALRSGHSVATWPLAPTGLTSVTDVRLNLVTTAPCTLVAMALRLVGLDWVPMNVDFDTYNGVLRSSVSRNGDPTAVVPQNQSLPALWYSEPVSGVDDPRPIDATMAVTFNTGGQQGVNEFAVLLRGTSGTETSQLLIQNKLQAQLNGPQPGQTTTALIPRTMRDFDGHLVKTLDTQSMEELDVYRISVLESWLTFSVIWGDSRAVEISKSSAPDLSYQWVASEIPAFADNTYYTAIITLEDTKARLQIFNLDQATLAIEDALFDTGVIPDSYQFTRRGGRIGWTATLQDGDASLKAIRPHAAMFAEYRSAPFNSITPVKGARIYARSSPHAELLESFTPREGVNGPTSLAPLVDRDTVRSLSGSSYRVNVNDTEKIGQGLVSNILAPQGQQTTGITDFSQLAIRFNLWFPSMALDQGSSLSVFLSNLDGQVVSLAMPWFSPDEWHPITLYPPSTLLQSGRYRLHIVYRGTAPAIFWIDNASVAQRTIVWEARASANDPWVTFNEIVNTDTGGAIFPNPGAHLQIRARALQQNAAVLTAPQIVPKYAELGRPVWPEDRIPNPFHGQLSPTIASQVTNRTVRLDASSSTPLHHIIDYQWSFGDGHFGSGPVVEHTYEFAGTYTANLTLVDAWGERTTTSADTTVS